jgi:hypothetical protein
MSSRLADNPRDPVQILILASSFRDDAPWFYELAVELYKAIRSGNRIDIADSHRRIRHALKMLSLMPRSHEMRRDWKTLTISFHELLSRIAYLESRDQEGAGPLSDSLLQGLEDGFEGRTGT